VQFTTMLTHEQILEILPDYALGSLDTDSAVAVSEHVAGCATCRAELQAWQATVGQLALAAPPVAPPDGLHRQLMQRVAPVNVRASATQPGRLAWLHSTAPVWGAVVVLLLVGLVAVNLNLSRQVTQFELSAPPMAVIPLTSEAADSAASGLVVVSADGEYGTLVVQDLPQLPADKAYQLWLIQNGQRTSGAVFTVDEHGYVALEIESPLPLDQYDAFGITLEPVGGSPGPTGSKILGSP
jgi:anti-sigma-K factor RskA